MKPVRRSRFRIALGKTAYTLARYMEWHVGSTKFAKNRNADLLPYVFFCHKTPLLRKLRDVDMWMQRNKVINLGIAVKRLNGLMVYPGETFSYWRLIGKPTRAKGYVPGMVLYYGKVQPGIGGGLCQLSNLIYWMTLHTPLMVTERYRHSYDVFPDTNRTQPFGSGATCVFNYRDLRIYNPTDNVFQLRVYITDEYLVGEWRTVTQPDRIYKVYEKEHWINHEYWGGYVRHNVLCRRIYDDRMQLLKDEYITENHAIMMYQPFLPEAERYVEQSNISRNNRIGR
jgi:vancomycin resistance protein VanW